MEFHAVLAAIRQRWYFPVAATVLFAIVAQVWLMAQVPIFQASAQVFVSSSEFASKEGGGIYQSAAFAQNRMASYALLVDSPQVLDPVTEQLGLPKGSLAGQVTATNPLETVLLTVTATNTSGEQAAKIANAAAVQLSSSIQKLETPSSASRTPIKVTVTDPATVPESPVSPKKQLTLVLAIWFGLGIGCGLAVLLEFLDTSIKRVDDLATAAEGSTVLGVILFDETAADNPLVTLNQHSVRGEAFKSVRTNLQYVDVDSPPRAIAVTSALPAEGKTTTACNLAISMAQAGLRVCLVEADFRRPRIAEYLGVDSSVGLTDVLVGRAELADVLLPWNRYLLTVLPSGPVPPNPSELLASQHMRSTLAVLRDDFDMVILDSAPLLPVADGAIASAAADGTLLVVRHGKTTRDQLAKALDALSQVDARLVGTVLNFAPAKRSRGYGYGYGYGYGDRAKSSGDEGQAVPVDSEAVPVEAAAISAAKSSDLPSG
ncbi:MAG: polysaccharide biosynthesis tyrosine autokinase [Candidatus Nanopelagicales bacterium]|nr:polysaccharide biosynthesis tyrosine autokinase [Candidatus Nanopelagicales bacterium]